MGSVGRLRFSGWIGTNGSIYNDGDWAIPSHSGDHMWGAVHSWGGSSSIKVKQIISATPGTEYTVSGWFFLFNNGSSGANTRARFYVNWLNSGGSTITQDDSGWTDATQYHNQWFQVTRDWTAPGGTVEAKLHCHLEADGAGAQWSKAAGDDFLFQEADTTPPSFGGSISVSDQSDLTPNVSITVQDTGSGLDISTAQYEYSTDGGSTWSMWKGADSALRSYGTGGSYWYPDMSHPGYTLQSGDVFEYDIYFPSDDVQHRGGMDLEMSGGSESNLRDSGTNDQNGISPHPSTQLTSQAYLKWYHRYFSVGAFVGTLNAIEMAHEADGVFSKYYVRNVRIVNGSKVRVLAYQDESSFSWPSEQYGPGNSGYSGTTGDTVNLSSGTTASCTGSDGTTSSQTITASAVPFNQYSSTQNKIRFRMTDMSGNWAQSSMFNVVLTSTCVESLTNGGFETGNMNGWTAWGSNDGAHGCGWYCSTNPVSGSYFNGNAASWGTKNGGYYQRLWWCHTHVYLSAWINTNCSSNDTTQCGLGIDPTGGTDPDGGSVQWSYWPSRGGWTQKCEDVATTNGSYVTFFIRHYHPNTQEWNISCFDDVAISPTEPCIAPATPANAAANPPTICAGGSSTLTASVSGATIYWYTGSCGGTQVGTGNSLVVTPGSTTTYYARAYNSTAGGCWSAGCGTATVTVSTGPSITSHPSSQSKCVGESVTFSVSASGAAPLSYQWRKDGGDVPGATDSSYSIGSVSAGDAGDYDCVVSNDCGSEISNAATLTVLSGPEVVNGSFEDGLNGWTQSGDPSWGNDGTFPNPGGAQHGSHWASISHGTGDGSDASLYQMVGCLTASQTVAVNAYMQTGGATGSATIGVKLHDGGIGGSVIGSTSYNIPPFHGAWTPIAVCGTPVNDYVTIEFFFQQATGSYNQNGFNIDNVSITQTCSGPTITSHPSSQTECVGQTVTFSVSATSSCPMTYQWQLDSGAGFGDISGATDSSYTTPVLTAGDDGSAYRCVVDDACGTPATSDAALLRVVSLPDTGLAVGAEAGMLCPGGSTNVTVDLSEVDVSYQLNDGVANVGSAVTGNGGTIYLPTGSLAATTTFNVKATRWPCSQVQLTQTVTVEVGDTTAPVITCPSDITVNADAGWCTAMLDPGVATATDNCDPAPAVTGVRSDSLLLTDPYPAFTTITWTATDACANSSQCVQTITVNQVNDLVISVQLSPSVVVSPFTRCITFDLWDCNEQTTVTVSETLTFTSGSASATIEVPCGFYDCITARDELHTLRSTDEDDFTISAAQYVADFTGDPATGGDWLIGGNLNDDGWIDILDFGVFMGEFNTNYGTANATCATPPPHADVSGDGLVATPDFTFIQLNFLKGSQPNCCGDELLLAGSSRSPDVNGDGRVDLIDMAQTKSMNGADPTVPGNARFDVNGDGSINLIDMALVKANNGKSGYPVQRISVEALRARGMGDLVPADLNGDGWLSKQDMAAFLGGARP